MSAKEYDLKTSEDSVGQLYPVLLAKDGKVIDGLHRLKSDKGWRTETLEQIDTEEKLLLARCIANWHRRSVPRAEKEEWIDGLAKIYKEQGFAAPLAAKVADETGLGVRTVMEYLSDDYKDMSKARTVPRPERLIPASQRIESELGPEYVERHREEVKEEVREEVKEEITAEVREEALRDPEFVVKAIEKAPEILATRRIPTVDRERYHVPTIEREVQAEAEQVSEEVDKEVKAIKEAPEIKEKSKLLRAWRALGVMLSQSEGLVCPICERVVTAYIKCSNCGDIPIAEAARVAREAIE